MCYLSGPTLSISLAVACLIVTAGCSQRGTEPEAKVDKELDTIDVETVMLELKPWPTIVRSQGSMVADEQTVVGAKVAGRVAGVQIELGDAVEAGEPMVTLDLNEFELEVVQAESQLLQARAAVGLAEGASAADLDPENAPPVRQEKAMWAESKSSLDRAQRLLGQNAVSQGEYDLALAAERAAEARHAGAINSVREKLALIGIREADLAVARQRLADATIRAPIDGYVRMRQVAPGTYVSIGQPIATIVRTDPLRFRGTVPERYAQSLSVGQEVRLKIIAIDEPYVTKIMRVSPALDAQSRALVFEADVSNPDQRFRSGVFAEAEIVVDSGARALVIPPSALTEFAGVEKVWKVVDGVASEQEVLAGPQREPGREIVRGLTVGDQILLRADQGRVARVGKTDRPTDPVIRSAVATPTDASKASEPGATIQSASESRDSQG